MEIALNEKSLDAKVKEDCIKPALASNIFLLNTINDIIDFSSAM